MKFMPYLEKHVMVPLAPFLEDIFRRLAAWSEGMAERVSMCPNCGRNRYTGKPCVGEDA